MRSITKKTEYFKSISQLSVDFSKLQQLKTDQSRGMRESVLLIEESKWMCDIKACV